MKRREQPHLFLLKAAQDKALLDAVPDSSSVSNEVFCFHSRQAAEKLLKALFSDIGAAPGKTHDRGSLIGSPESAGFTPPAELRVLDELTPFGVLYRVNASRSQ